jgi:surface antigen
VSYQLFENGSIVSSKYGTFPISGAIRQAFLSRGGLEGRLGAPKGSQEDRGDGNAIQYFEHGNIYLKGSNAFVYEEGTTPPKTSPNIGSQLGVTMPNFNLPAYRENNIFWQSGYAPASTHPSSTNLGSALGNCTWYVNGRLQQLGYNTTALNKLSGNASEWDNQAAAAGISMSNTPQVGDIAQWETGHVAVVEKVNPGGTILISESSYTPNSGSAADYLYKTETIPASSPSRFIRLPSSAASGINYFRAGSENSPKKELIIPEGFTKINSGIGVDVYQHSDDYVQVVRLDYGAKLQFLLGADRGNNLYDNQTIDEAWDSLKKKEKPFSPAFSVINGQDFEQFDFILNKLGWFNSGKGELIRPLRIDEKTFHSSSKDSPMLAISKDNGAFIGNYGSEEFEKYPNVLGGQNYDAEGKDREKAGRTFLSVLNLDEDPENEVVFLLTTKSATQKEAGQILESFGSEKNTIIMLDGSGSTKLNVRGTPLISGDSRRVPQFIGVLEGNPWYGQPTNLV